VRAASMYQAFEVEHMLRAIMGSARIRDSLPERPRRAKLAPSYFPAQN
jgi:hypothetical protein